MTNQLLFLQGAAKLQQEFYFIQMVIGSQEGLFNLVKRFPQLSHPVLFKEKKYINDLKMQIKNKNQVFKNIK